MTTYSWKSGASGDWSVAGNWTPADAPNDYSATAVIAAPGSYTVAVGENDYWTVGGLVLADPGASLDVAGILQSETSTFENNGVITIDGRFATFSIAAPSVGNLGSIVLSDGYLFLDGKIHTSALAGLKTSDGTKVGTLQLINTGATLSIGLGGAIAGFGGYIIGGVLQEAAAPTSYGDLYVGELNDVSIHGTLFAAGGVTIANGITFAGYNGSGIGGFDYEGGGAGGVFVKGSTTLDHANFTIDGGGFVNEDNVGNQTLTLGANLVFTLGPFANIDAGTLTGDSAINLGTIIVISGEVEGTSFTNAGTITIASGDALSIQTATFDNPGTVIVDGGVLELGETINTLSGVTLDAGTLFLMGTVDNIAGLSWTSGSTLQVYGDLVNTDSTLSVTNYASSGLQLNVVGTITGGVVVDPDGLLQPSVLDGVAYCGVLRSTSVVFRDGFDLTGAQGTGSGVAHAIGGIEVDDLSTIDNAALGIGQRLTFADSTASGTLTLGPSLFIQNFRALTIDEENESNGRLGAGTLINEGRITAGYSRGAGSLAIAVQSFKNLGTLSVVNGNSLLVQAKSFTNLSAGTLSLGRYWVGAGSVLEINGGAITTLAANLTVSGAGSVARTVAAGGTATTLESSLTQIASGGRLAVLGGRDYMTAGSLSDKGALILGGGTLSAAGLTIAGGAVLGGSGAVSAPIVVTGLVDARGGSLQLSGSVSGSGSLRIEAASLLEVSVASSRATFADGTGTLQLDNGAGFTGAVGGLSLGDAIRFATETISSAFVTGGTLTVTGSAGTTHYAVAGALAGNHFAVQSDAHTLHLVAGAAQAHAASASTITTHVISLHSGS